MKLTKNNLDKKNFQNFSKYVYEQSDSPNTDTSIPTKKELQQVYLLMQYYKKYDKLNKKNNITTPPLPQKTKNNTETKHYKWNTSLTTQNKHFQNIPPNKKPMTRQHQQETKMGQDSDQDSSDESQSHSSDHSDSSETNSSSPSKYENSQKNSSNFSSQPETNQNDSTSESDPPQQYQKLRQQNSQDSFYISKEQVRQNSATYGLILNSPDPNYTHVRLYRLPTMLTSKEFKRASDNYLYHKGGHKPCQNYLFVDVTKKTMFRCPLPSCKHKPLNNLMIQQALKKHCKDYHDDGNNYIFHYKTDETWKEIHYPPQSTNKKIENPMTQQYNTQKGQKFNLNSKNSYECKGKNPLTTLPNNSYNQNNYKGKNPFPTFSNNSYNNNHHKGKSPYTNEPNNSAYDKNDHKGKNPFPTFPNNSYVNNQYESPYPCIPLVNPQYSNPNNYTNKEPCTYLTNNNYDKNYHKGKSPYTNEPNDTAYDKNSHKGKNPFRETKPEDELGKKEDDTTSSSTPSNSPLEQITPEPLPISET